MRLPLGFIFHLIVKISCVARLEGSLALLVVDIMFPVLACAQAVLLAGWIRTGTWATEAGARLLEVALDGHTATEAAGTPGAAHASISPACANSSAVVIDPQLPEAAQPAPSGGEDAGEGSAASSVAEAGQRGMTLSVRLKGGKVRQPLSLAPQHVA